MLTIPKSSGVSILVSTATVIRLKSRVMICEAPMYDTFLTVLFLMLDNSFEMWSFGMILSVARRRIILQFNG